MVVFAAPQLREYEALCNDPSSFDGRARTDEAVVKTRHPGDRVATRAGGSRSGIGRARLQHPFRAIFEAAQRHGSIVVTSASFRRRSKRVITLLSHRDVKPENVLLVARGGGFWDVRVKLCELGLSTRVRAAQEAPAPSPACVTATLGASEAQEPKRPSEAKNLISLKANNGDDEEATIDVDEETAVSIFVLQINELAQGLDQATRDEIFSKGRAITDKVVEILANNAIRQDALNRENEERTHRHCEWYIPKSKRTLKDKIDIRRDNVANGFSPDDSDESDWDIDDDKNVVSPDWDDGAYEEGKKDDSLTWQYYASLCFCVGNKGVRVRTRRELTTLKTATLCQTRKNQRTVTENVFFVYLCICVFDPVSDTVQI
ncbi:hypothetical protein AURANDRAFT_68081 [Aureococcus anophagefferens]|uniref:Protein kinase domain-containing protein n=1 Tax=Aureococcus anophagefferens TaxID=44056 RepID=F0YNF2_AURAN|nr:hypothetical protein AURANDRAFT_68081 [Aureococcus anophagefferens]EGB03364.1 hypothetical protein AURANDRAFT_68081 [Aureococcus anophagefferens]|eukprot:XP_009041937.1 hypothetical protein AURANDRAFT_68081 [Aureococcus anophagefferens]